MPYCRATGKTYSDSTLRDFAPASGTTHYLILHEARRTTSPRTTPHIILNVI
ncbi:MAG: hypothetical protein SPL26_08410 [Bacteroidales bacterium]|nr:hypothetical protein [Bacteroidales bacterium]MDY6378154.1 hypothetical protein [Bacteroidales bacterium]MDY6385533.1 hypothetical protein [Bacteroidales bacterium]